MNPLNHEGNKAQEASKMLRLAPTDLAHLENGTPNPLREAVILLARFAQSSPASGRFEDAFSSYSEGAAATHALFRLGRTSLDFLERDFLTCEAKEIEFLRGELAAFEALAPKTPEERVADAYWQAMEKLSAAGLDFEALLDYHCQSDGNTEL